MWGYQTPTLCRGSWLSMVLGLAMMVLDVRKNLKPTQFYLLYNLCYNNFAKKSSPEGVLALGSQTDRHSLALGLLLAVLWPWTWPRWSWMSGKALNQPSSPC